MDKNIMEHEKEGISEKEKKRPGEEKRPYSVRLTEKAAIKVKEIIKENKFAEDSVIRIKVEGGGCAGFQYGLQVEDADSKNKSDILFDSFGVKMLVDEMSLMFLVGIKGGTEVDYVTDNLIGTGFKFNNKNTAAACGCGNSFEV